MRNTLVIGVLTSALIATTGLAHTDSSDLQVDPKTFKWYCESDEATSAQKHTVKALYAMLEKDPAKVDCRKAAKFLSRTRTFTLAKSKVTDLAPLAGFNQVETLDLSGNTLSSLGTLPILKALTTLSLVGNPFTQVPALSKWPTLTSLDLSATNITSLPAGKDIAQLSALSLGATAISDFGPLKDAALTSLDLSELKDPAALATLPEISTLTSLTVAKLKLTELSVVKKTPALQALNAADNQLADLTGIEAAPKLATLNLEGNPVAAISAGQLPKAMKSLNLSGTAITDFAFLKGIKFSGDLVLSNTAFATWRYIAHNFDTLESLALTNTKISEITYEESDPTMWPNFQAMALDGTQITSLLPMARITAPKFFALIPPALPNKTEDTCPTKNVPPAIEMFCS